MAGYAVFPCPLIEFLAIRKSRHERVVGSV